MGNHLSERNGNRRHIPLKPLFLAEKFCWRSVLDLSTITVR